jgi:hypothetical protein
MLLTEQYRFNAADFDRFHHVLARITELLDQPPDSLEPWEAENYPKIVTHFGFFALFFDTIAIAAMNYVTFKVKVPEIGRITLPVLEYKIREADPLTQASLLPVYTAGMQQALRAFDALLPRILQECQTRGYPTIYAAVQTFSWVDYDRLAVTAEKILTHFSPRFVTEFSQFLTQTRPGFHSLTYGDLFWLVKTPLDEFRVDPQKVIDTLQSLVTQGGLQYTDADRLSFDLDIRPNKTPTAFFGFVPSHTGDDPDFVIVSGVTAGLTAMEILLHESGHALHFLNMSPTLPRLARYLGDFTITEVIAMLVEQLTLDPTFLMEILPDGYSAAKIAEIARLLEFRETYRLLYYAIRFLGVRELYQLDNFFPENINTIREKDRSRFLQYLGVDRPAYDLTKLSDQIMHDASAFHAFWLSRQLRFLLIERYGSRWWTDAGAWRWLHEHWIAPGFTLDMAAEGLDIYGEHLS